MFKRVHYFSIVIYTDAIRFDMGGVGEIVDMNTEVVGIRAMSAAWATSTKITLLEPLPCP